MITHSKCPPTEVVDDGTVDLFLVPARQALAAEINAAPPERAGLEARYGQVWNTAELGRDFEVLEFAAPFVIVKRKADQQLASLLFQNLPRYYFSFQADRGNPGVTTS
jgi:hypothetical protein